MGWLQAALGQCLLETTQLYGWLFPWVVPAADSVDAIELLRRYGHLSTSLQHSVLTVPSLIRYY